MRGSSSSSSVRKPRRPVLMPSSGTSPLSRRAPRAAAFRRRRRSPSRTPDRTPRRRRYSARRLDRRAARSESRASENSRRRRAAMVRACRARRRRRARRPCVREHGLLMDRPLRRRPARFVHRRTDRPSRRNSMRNSRFPAGPSSGEASRATGTSPSAKLASRTSRRTARCVAGSRTTPPEPRRSRPASNCGFTSATIAPPGDRYARARSRMVRSEMNDASTTIASNGSPNASSPSLRKLVRSITVTRSSLRRRQSSCPYPTSTATTCAAPRCSKQSVNPPVEAPTSSARAPVTSMPKASSARSSFSPPRLTKRRGLSISTVACGPTFCPAL